jgi:hypothetical protein
MKKIPNPTEMQANPMFQSIVNDKATNNFWEGIDFYSGEKLRAVQMPYSRPNKPIPAAPSAMPPSVPKEPPVPVVPLTKSSKNYLYIGLGIAAIIIGATLVIKNKTT